MYTIIERKREREREKEKGERHVYENVIKTFNIPLARIKL